MTDSLHNTSDIKVRSSSNKISLFSKVALILSLLALLVAAWQWINTVKHFNQLEQILSEKLTRFDANNQQSLTLSKMAEERSLSASAQIALLNQQLAESRNQQEALQTLYNELADNRETRVVTEVEQLLVIANQQLQLASNVKSALLALQTAQNRLQQLNTSQSNALSHSLAFDIKKLQDLPVVDVPEMGSEIESLARSVDSLTLVSARHPKPKMKATKDKDTNMWHRLSREVWSDLTNIIRLERIDRAEPPLLEENQEFFLRENIRLRLLTARIALLQHDETSYRNDLKTAQNWLISYFDTREKITMNMLSSIKKLSANSIIIQIPDISESVNLVSKYKLSLESIQEVKAAESNNTLKSNL